MKLNIPIILLVVIVIIVFILFYLRKNVKDKRAMSEELNAENTSIEHHENKEPE